MLPCGALSLPARDKKSAVCWIYYNLKEWFFKEFSYFFEKNLKSAKNRTAPSVLFSASMLLILFIGNLFPFLNPIQHFFYINARIGIRIVCDLLRRTLRYDRTAALAAFRS